MLVCMRSCTYTHTHACTHARTHTYRILIDYEIEWVTIYKTRIMHINVLQYTMWLAVGSTQVSIKLI